MKKLILIALMASFGGLFAAPSVFVVDTSQKFQVFTGWGASQRNLTYSNEILSQAADAAYSSPGLNFNIFRASIVPYWDFSNWTGETDKLQSDFLSLIKSKGANIFYASSATPPANLKTNGKLAGDFSGDPTNTIPESKFEEYAKYLASFVQGYNENRGIDFDYVSIQNEPDVSSTDLSCMVAYEDYKAMFKIVGDEFAAQSLDVKLMGPETSGWNSSFSYLQRIFSAPAISKYLRGISTHSYKSSQNRNIIAGFAKDRYIKEIWQTKWSDTLGSGSNPDDMQNAVKWAQTIITDLNVGSATAWLAASIVGQPDSSLLAIDGSNIRKTKRYYALAQFSKFIRPGATRVSALNGSAKLALTAWLSVDRKSLTILAVNSQSAAAELTLVLPFSCASDFTVKKTLTNATENLVQKPDILASDGVLNETLEPLSIATYVISISDVEPGPQVALTNPPAGAVSQPLSIDFNWDVFPGADRYAFVLAKDAAFADTISANASSVPGATVENLERSTAYYWRVKAFKQSMVIACSPVASFRTINVLPAKVNLALPTDGKEVSPDKVIFAWSISTPAVDRYELQLTTDSTFNQVDTTSTVNENKAEMGSLKEFTKYWWRVRAGNDGGWSDWSSTRSITTTKSASFFESLPEEAIKLSPNPANDILSYELNLELNSPLNIMIYDASGALILERRNARLMGVLDVHAVPTGAYFLVMECEGAAAVEQFTIVR